MTIALAATAPARPVATTALAWLALAGIALAALMDAVNGTVLSISGAQIMGGTHATPDEIAWVNMAYLMVKLTTFPLAAWMVVRFGARQPLLWAVCLLIGASAAAGLTTSLEALVAWRAAQGALGAVLLVAGQAALFAMFPRDRQGLVQATFALSIVMGPTTVAPALQGWITDSLSWSWIFILNLPVGALGVLALLGGIEAAPNERRSARFDGIGLVLLAVAMACLVFVLQEGSRYGWFEEAEIIHLSIIGTAALVLFIGWEIRAQARGALIDLRVFHDEHFTFGFIVSFVAGFALFGSAFAIPAFGLQVLSLTPTHAGLLLLPSGLLVGLGLLTAGSLIQIKGVAPFKLVPIGILCFMTAMWMLSHSTIDSGAPDMTPALLLRGLGLGFLFVSLTMVALVGPKGPLNPQGIALFNFGRQFGGLIGIAFLLTYLDHQLALNRSVLSINLTPGNPWLAERQAAAAEFLTSRGYNPDEAMGAAVAVIQGQVSQQVTVLSFNEVFLAVALLFVVAAPVLIVTRLLLKRLLGATAQRTDPYVRRHEKVARSSSNRRLYSPRLTTSARDANPDRDRLPILTSIRSGSRAAKPRFLTVRFRQQHQAPGTTELGAIWPRAEGQLRSRRSSKAALCLASSGRLIRRSAHPIAL